MSQAECKILSVIGARPQFVKAAVVSRAFQRLDGIQEVLVHTGQHYDWEMSEVFFRELQIPAPAYNLNAGSGSHAAQTAKMLCGLEEVMEREQPRRVLIYGDTNSTLAGALAAAKLQIPVDHVEAGLRSFNRAMPEEINRIVADRLSDLLFCPTRTAVENLAHEGITEGVRQVGDVMYDATRLFSERSQSAAPIFDRLGLASRRYVLMTLHRAENTTQGKNLGEFLAGLAKLDAPVVFPVHPRTAKLIEQLNIVLPENVRCTPPVSYLEMLQLEKHAQAILTDSGGVQKEAYFMRVPCVTLREETEWVETVQSGWNRLAGLNAERAVEALRKHANGARRSDFDCFGDGHAASVIAGEECRALSA